MSFEDMKCPCGGRKETATLICNPCREAIRESDRARLLDIYDDHTNSTESRRGTAIQILAIARRRNRPPQRQFNLQY